MFSRSLFMENTLGICFLSVAIVCLCVRGKNDYDCKEAHEQRGFCLLKQVQGNSGRQFESVLYELHQRDFSSQRQLFFWRNKKSVK